MLAVTTEQHNQRRRRAVAATVHVTAAADAQLGFGVEQASGVLVALPQSCIVVLVTAAHVLKCSDRSAARDRAGALSGVVLQSGLAFGVSAAEFWRIDTDLDLVVIAVAVASRQSYSQLADEALPGTQFSTIQQLCSIHEGNLMHVCPFLHYPMQTVGTCTRNGEIIYTVQGAPLLLDYAAHLHAGASGSAVYDGEWWFTAVHVRGDAAQGRGVSSDALRTLICNQQFVPLGNRIRLRQQQVRQGAEVRGDSCDLGTHSTCKPVILGALTPPRSPTAVSLVPRRRKGGGSEPRTSLTVGVSHLQGRPTARRRLDMAHPVEASAGVVGTRRLVMPVTTLRPAR